MDNKPLPDANFQKGIPAIFVVVGLLLVLAALTFAVYIVGSEVSKSSAGDGITSSFQQLKDQVVQKAQELTQPNVTQNSAVPETNSDTAPAEDNSPPSQSASNNTTYDIGAYLTYGNQALSLDRAVAKVTPDRKRLIVGLFEKTQSSKEKPAMAMIFEFKAAKAKCSVENVKELALLFNLRSMGDIAAQQVQVVKRTADDLALALTNFSCDLKPGGKLEMHSLGSDQTLIKPRGSTFAWGLRLTQEIG